MKKSILYIFIFVSLFSFSQAEKENYKLVSLSFLKYYNEANYEAIFNMFDAKMQAALPKDKALAFFEYNVAPAGKIKTMEFYEVKQTTNIYKSTFEKATLDVLISLDDKNKINGFYIKPHIPKNLPIVERNSTKMRLPFKGEWTVFWGGTTVEDNYHVAYNNQKYAYDIVITRHGKTFKKDRSKNENFYAFGKEIFAPSNGTIVHVFRGVKDNVPGEMNATIPHGNTVVLKTTNNEFIVFSHFKENSIKVKRNQEVKQGDLLGLCGNSGNTSEPHLHLSLQNVADRNIATGGKLFFDKIKVNGKVKEDYIPIKNDKIQNIKL